jgi:hypothetical protein|tara:strand:- start:686 stop:901 length:216 start_codon:yes stop_codon:yes gene_type:complete
MRFNIFGKKMSNENRKADLKKRRVEIDLSTYSKENRVEVDRPSLYSFDSFVEDLDTVTNPKPLKNTEIIEI